MYELTRNQYVCHEATLCIKEPCVYLSRHAIFNEQSDLDHRDIISHDLVRLVML